MSTALLLVAYACCGLATVVHFIRRDYGLSGYPVDDGICMLAIFLFWPFRLVVACVALIGRSGAWLERWMRAQERAK